MRAKHEQVQLRGHLEKMVVADEESYSQQGVSVCNSSDSKE